MSAFNDLQFEGVCPACGVNCGLAAQFHCASSFDGDDTGLFCHRSYRVGEDIAWWPRQHAEYDSWIDEATVALLYDDAVRQCCHTTCVTCLSDLYAVLEFIPVKVRAV